MLRPKKKITKRQLKEDALVTSYAKVRSFYDEHRRTISISITAAAVVIIALVVYVKNRQENSDAALARLGAIQTYFDSGQYQLALAGVPERNIPGLAAIVDEFGGSPGGEIARFYLANVYYKLGEYDQALSQFEEFSAPNAILEASRGSRRATRPWGAMLRQLSSTSERPPRTRRESWLPKTSTMRLAITPSPEIGNGPSRSIDA
jgi:tetratricopeptide (TPR) repeat protein